MAMSSLLVSITNSMLGRPPISLMPPSERSSLSRSRRSRSNSFLVRPELWAEPSVSSMVRRRRIELRDGLPVGERAAQPAVVHIILGAAFGRGRDRLGRLALGAHEKDTAAAGHHFAQRHKRLVQKGNGLGQVDNMDVVALEP